MSDQPIRRRRTIPLLHGLPPEVGVLSAIAFCVALGFGIVAPAIPVFAKSFNVSTTAATSVVAVFALMRFVSSPGAGWLVNRIGERVTLATGLGIVAVSSALAGLSADFTQLLVLRGLGGLGSSMFTVSALALLLRVVGPAQRGRAAGAFQGGFLAGGVAGPALGGLVTGISLRLPFFIYAATLGVALVVALAFLTRTHLREREEKAGTLTGRGVTMPVALRDSAYRAALSVNFGSGFAFFGLRSAIIPLFVVEGLKRGPEVTGIGLLVSAAVQAALLLPAGRMADTRGRKPALLVGTGAATLGMLLLVVSGSSAMFYVSMAVFGAGSAFLGSAPSAVVGDVTGGARGGIVVAVYQMFSDLGAIIGPLAAGVIVDATGSFALAFGVGTAVGLFGLVMAVLMRETLPTAARGPTAPATAGGASPERVSDHDDSAPPT